MLSSFVILTILFWIGGIAVFRVFMDMIKADAPIDIAWAYMTGRSYQKMLADMYASDNKAINNLGKALGDCEMCASFWFMPIWSIFYYAFCKLISHYWITSYLTRPHDLIYYVEVYFVNLVWIAIFVSVGSVSSRLLSTLFKKP